MENHRRRWKRHRRNPPKRLHKRLPSTEQEEKRKTQRHRSTMHPHRKTPDHVGTPQHEGTTRGERHSERMQGQPPQATP